MVIIVVFFSSVEISKSLFSVNGKVLERSLIKL